MMKYRSRTDITAQILEAANGGAAKTKIMYKAYLSFAQLKQYMSMLLVDGMLEHDQRTNEYKTTAKGLKLLKTYYQMGEMMKVAVETPV